MSGVTMPAVTAAVLSLAVLLGGYWLGERAADPQLRGAVVTQSAPAAPVDGSTLFAANCAGCHGPSAQGGLGPKLAGRSRAWPLPIFQKAVMDGQAPEGRALSATMPHFRQAGFDGSPPTDTQLKAVLAFLQKEQP